MKQTDRHQILHVKLVHSLKRAATYLQIIDIMHTTSKLDSCIISRISSIRFGTTLSSCSFIQLYKSSIGQIIPILVFIIILAGESGAGTDTKHIYYFTRVRKTLCRFSRVFHEQFFLQCTGQISII